MAKELTKKISTEKKRLATEHEAFLEDMFNDIYKNRKRIYQVNFVRGLFFGLGTFLGGTVVVAIIVWILSRFVNWPFIENLVQTLQK